MTKIKQSLKALLGIFALVSIGVLLAPFLTTVQGEKRTQVINGSNNNAGVAATISSVKDIPGTQPFYAVTSTTGALLANVPEGKLLVVELITGEAGVQIGDLSQVTLQIDGPQRLANFRIGPSMRQPIGTVGFIETYTHSVRFYVLPHEQLRAFMSGNTAVQVSGHYLDIQ